MLGHEKFDTTLIYANIPSEILRKNIAKVTDKKPLSGKKWDYQKKKEKRISLSFNQKSFTVGRLEEIKSLEDNISKGLILLLGDMGVGKSLDNFKCEKKVLRLDDSGTIKKSLGATPTLFVQK